jgi:hypothetical protein
MGRDVRYRFGPIDFFKEFVTCQIFITKSFQLREQMVVQVS